MLCAASPLSSIRIRRGMALRCHRYELFSSAASRVAQHPVEGTVSGMVGSGLFGPGVLGRVRSSMTLLPQSLSWRTADMGKSRRKAAG